MEQPIKYFSFGDVPRTFAFEQAGRVYVLTSEFDDDLDEYPDETRQRAEHAMAAHSLGAAMQTIMLAAHIEQHKQA